MNKIEKKLNLLLKCWLSDKAGTRDKDIVNEQKLIKEVSDVLGVKK